MLDYSHYVGKVFKGTVIVHEPDYNYETLFFQIKKVSQDFVVTYKVIYILYSDYSNQQIHKIYDTGSYHDFAVMGRFEEILCDNNMRILTAEEFEKDKEQLIEYDRLFK